MVPPPSRIGSTGAAGSSRDAQGSGSQRSRGNEEGVSMEAAQVARPASAAADAQAGSGTSGVKASAVAADVPKTPSCEEAAPATFEQLGEDEESGEAQGGDDLEVDAHLLEEERKLAQERERQEARPQGNPALDKGSFSKLDVLLDQTMKYSEFVLENMDDITMMNKCKSKKAVGAEGEGGKRKRGRGRGRPPKKQKEEAEPSLASKISSAGKRKKGQKEAEGDGGEGEEEEGEGEEEEEEEEADAILREQRQIAPNLENCNLKPYQLKGVKWLISLWQNGLNGILADQMGLGKTVQTITFLCHLISRGMHGPFMVVAPLSTLSNWINEFKRFAPSVNVLLYHGSREERAELREKHLGGSVGPGWPVIVTSFEVVLNDRKKFQKYSWKYLVVDEGHRLKNFNCKLIQELRQMQVENTLLLTGTPLQNNLTELWSLLNFLLPSIFTNLPEFTAWFDLDGRQSGASGQTQEVIDAARRSAVVSKLHAILRPFLLRRIKADVEKSLPKKKEVVLYAQMTAEQRQFHEHLVSRTLEEFLNSRAPVIAKSRLNNVMMQLRKNCNHPDLLSSHFDGSYEYPPVETLLEQCGKLKLLDRLLVPLRARGHKVLIFSQMTRLLDILDYFLEERGHRAARIDGSVKLADRRAQIDEFNTPGTDLGVFLLSTRAGGLGINLTAADTVIIYDSDWNPHCDMQAMDRCHRIGQTKPVHVYRLCTAHSVECRMLEVANKKLKLETMVIERGQFVQEKSAGPASKGPSTITGEDLEALLRPSQSAHQERIQSAEISDGDLHRLLDRTDMMPPAHPPAKGQSGGAAQVPPGLPAAGPGWEVVASAAAQSSLLSSIS